MGLKEILKGKLSEEELKILPRSFDIIGSREKAIAITEIPEGLKGKEKIIAEGIMKLNKNVKTVLKKVSERKGIERLREYEFLAGDENTEVVHKEFGYLLKLDPRKVYFSPREAEERQRIANKVKDSEKVLVMFSGIAPFCIAIAKKKNVKVYGIEINEEAHRYAKINVGMNGLSDKVVLIKGDVRKICPKLKEKFDRIVMPLPLGSENFLDLAFKCIKKGGIIHFYNWGSEENLYENGIKGIEKEARKLKKKVKILEMRKVLPYAPKRWKVCIDLKVL
ncbi:MAG: class I SAM-dependent methyltransferase family protein [Candidatus Aenigmatarchaeota archaeon]